jgi:hypothetical protein
VDVGQAAAGCGQGIAQLGFVVAQAAIQSAQVGQQVTGKVAAAGVGRGARSDTAKQRWQPCRCSGAARLRRDQLAQQLVQAVEQARAFSGEVVAALRQQPQDHGLVFDGDDAQPVMLVQSDLGDGVGVVVVALAATACASQPHPRGERGGTSSTCSPVAVSCWAMPRPRP